MSLKLITSPDAIMTLVDAKAHLNVDDADRDTYITGLIDVVAYALDGLDGEVGKALVTQTWEYSTYLTGTCVDIPLTPVQSIVSISYYDADNAVQALSVTDYDLYKSEDVAQLMPKPGKAWPSLYPRPDALTVTFIAGYGDPSEVPATIVHAAKLLLSHYYENREAVTIGVKGEILPQGVETLISRHKKGWFSG